MRLLLRDWSGWRAVRLVGLVRPSRGRGPSSRPASRSRPCVGSVSRDVQITLKPSTPTLSMTCADERRAVDVLAGLRVQTEQAAQQAVERVAAPAAARTETLLDHLLRRDDVRRDRVHHVLGVALDQRHERGDPVDDDALLRRGERGHQAGAVTLPADDLDQFAEGSAGSLAQDGGIGLDAVRQRGDLVEHVLAHPRHGAELHPVGDLVQAYPQPEVGRIDAELPLDAHHVRRDEQQLAVALVEELELPEHLAGQEAEHRARLHAGDPPADRLGRACRPCSRQPACRRAGS